MYINETIMRDLRIRQINNYTYHNLPSTVNRNKRELGNKQA